MQLALRVVTVLLCVLTSEMLTIASEGTAKGTQSYALSTWSNATCRAKGRFQDREYCSSPVIDQIVADEKDAIPRLISQITDSRTIAEPVYDFWPRIRAGELAYFILDDLFLDDTWQKSTMAPLFPSQPCTEAAWECWAGFRKKHSLNELHAKWMHFWIANEKNVYWDSKARCFRVMVPHSE